QRDCGGRGLGPLAPSRAEVADLRPRVRRTEGDAAPGHQPVDFGRQRIAVLDRRHAGEYGAAYAFGVSRVRGDLAARAPRDIHRSAQLLEGEGGLGFALRSPTGVGVQFYP